MTHPKYNPDRPATQDQDEADENTPTVGVCAEAANGAVQHYTKWHGEDDMESTIKDLVIDLLHLCDREGISGNYVLDYAGDVWGEERAPELPIPHAKATTKES